MSSPERREHAKCLSERVERVKTVGPPLFNFCAPSIDRSRSFRLHLLSLASSSMSKLLLRRAQPVVMAARSGLLLTRIISGAPKTPAANAARGSVSFARPQPRRSSLTTKLFSAPASSSSSPSSPLLSLLDQAASDPLTFPFDAIMVLGGGIETSDGSLPPWVLSRLDFAAELQRESCSRFSLSSSSPPSPPSIVLLGAGTPHKPPPPDGDTGRALTEAKAAARYLLSNEGGGSGNGLRPGLPLPPPPWSILKEEASFDTVGNALFGLTTHALPAGWTRIAVVTSSFHMPRARAIFSKTFGLASEAFRGSGRGCQSRRSGVGDSLRVASAPASAAAGGGGGEEGQILLPPFDLSFLATTDKYDLLEDVREARAAREAASTAVRDIFSPALSFSSF